MIEQRLFYITGALFVGSFAFAMLAGAETFVGVWFAVMSLLLGMGALGTGFAVTAIVLNKESKN